MAITNAFPSIGKQQLLTLAGRLKHLANHPWLPRLVTITALLLLTASMAKWTWLVVKPPLPRVVADMTRTTETSTFDIQKLLDAHLFGQAMPEPGLDTTSLEDIPTSSLNLVLTGIVAAGDESFVLLRVDDQPEAPFAIGQEIIHGVTLHVVYPDRAIILRGGTTESLILEDVAALLQQGAVVTTPHHGVYQQGNNRFAVDRGLISSQLRKPDFLRQALIVPNAGGGFLVRRIQPGSVYGKLGLRPGDVIRKVNGRTVNSVDDVIKVYQELGGLERLAEVQLEIMRTGKVQQLQYTVQ